MTKEQETELHKIARETYVKARIGRPHMPTPDSVDGQRKIDRLFDILARQFQDQD